MNLRERCERLAAPFGMHLQCGQVHMELIALLQVFAQEIRNEAIEQCAVRIEVMADMDRDYGASIERTKDMRWLCAKMIRLLKDDASQANGPTTNVSSK